MVTHNGSSLSFETYSRLYICTKKEVRKEGGREGRGREKGQTPLHWLKQIKDKMPAFNRFLAMKQVWVGRISSRMHKARAGLQLSPPSPHPAATPGQMLAGPA